MITGIVGPFGSGKTLLMANRLFRRYLQGMAIYTNFATNFPAKPLQAIDLVKMSQNLNDCGMGIDEIHVLIDSRNSMTEANKLISYFILQTRKRNVYLFYTTQDEMQVEKRLRRNTDYWVYCTRVGKHTFRYRVYNRTGKCIKNFTLDGRKSYNLYNTKETVMDWSLKAAK